MTARSNAGASLMLLVLGPPLVVLCGIVGVLSAPTALAVLLITPFIVLASIITGINALRLGRSTRLGSTTRLLATISLICWAGIGWLIYVSVHLG